jgi:hypothetical protein
MPEVEHNILTGAQLHSSKVVTFTGDPSSYVPTEAGILVQCLTAPNAGKLYRTTGTTAGALMSGSAADGQAATVSIGAITTGNAGSNATVTNSGTTSAAVLDFTIPRGDAGAGAFGIRYTFSTSTSSGPGAGLLRLNNASPASATQLYVSETDRNGAAIASLLGTIANGAPIQILDESDPLAFAYYTVSSATDNGTDRTLAVTHVASNGTLAGGVTLTWGLTGAAGSSATSGFGFKYSFNSTTTSGPAAGQVRLNNAASASATQVFIHETDRNSKAIASLLGLITPGTGLMLVSESDPSLYAYYTVTSSTDNGNDRTLAVAHVASNGTLSGNVTVSIAGGGTGGVQGIGTASPLNSITPLAANSLYVQRTTVLSDAQGAREVVWVATGTTSASWVVASSSAIRRNSTSNPNTVVTANFAGQFLINYAVDIYGNSTAATLYVSGSGATSWYAV